MADQSTLLIELVLWVVFAVVVALVRSRTHQLSVGLVVAYMVNLWLIHWPAALTYLLPWYLPVDAPAVFAGFEQSFYALAAFGFGALTFGPLLTKTLAAPRAESDAATHRLPDARLPYVYLLVGILSYLVVNPLLGDIPTITAISAGTNQLIIVGFCLLLWHGWYARKRRLFASALVAACMIPLVTILRDGFLSYGAMALIVIMAFLTIFVRPRWALVAVLLVVAYTGFSFYVTYMRDRREIRAAVWGGQAAGERISSLSGSIRTIEWFDPQDPEHLMRVNARLNQNYLVGAAVQNLRSGTRQFARGQTVFEALQSLVPRALWPDKPTHAGSPRIVSDYTGITFAAHTSVGVGQVMEFYINFGSVGVIIGFMLFGTILCLLDTWAAQRLWKGDWLQFAVWFLPGVAMMQAGGSLVEVVSSAGAAILAALFVNHYIARRRMGPPRRVPVAALHR
ncbi:MAG: O-antigen polysaccharide polymerase Wzy [Gemmatimonadota bacterium]